MGGETRLGGLISIPQVLFFPGRQDFLLGKELARVKDAEGARYILDAGQL